MELRTYILLDLNPSLCTKCQMPSPRRDRGAATVTSAAFANLDNHLNPFSPQLRVMGLLRGL